MVAKNSMEAETERGRLDLPAVVEDILGKGRQRGGAGNEGKNADARCGWVRGLWGLGGMEAEF